MDTKLITYAIPCYNSAEYMDACIESILACNRPDDIEIIVVDDGSVKDNTLEKARIWESTNPGVVRAIHQENGGHGAAVMTGLEHARGTYFKVVDSDDWLDNEANVAMLDKLASFDEPLDLMLVNYVYEHTADNTSEVMSYRRMLPEGQLFTWDDCGHFGLTKYILMHSVVYRTQMLRDCGLTLPRHTFYVDNIFVYVPLPQCERIYYMDIDLYRYFIGREDQSVNESVMIGRIDQQLRVTRVMIDSFLLERDVKSPRLRSYMRNYLTMMMVICTVFSMMSDREDKEQLRADIWKYLRDHDYQTYLKIRRSVMGVGTHLPGKAGDKVLLSAYHIAQKVFKFN
ncbi:MAG: glycosyltransferase [Coriobacteriales bacterium]